MRKMIGATILACAFASAIPAPPQVKTTKEQIMFYTSGWKGERFPDGRPRVPDDLLRRALDVSIEDVWDYLDSLATNASLTAASRPCVRRSPSPVAPSPRNTCPYVPT
jgi:hypothetical protein